MGNVGRGKKTNSGGYTGNNPVSGHEYPLSHVKSTASDKGNLGYNYIE